MNRSQLRTLVKANIGNRTDKDTIINMALEIGLNQSVNLHFFKSLMSEYDSDIDEEDNSITLPTTTFQLIEARLINGTSSYPLEIKTKNWMSSRFPNAADDSEGIPLYGFLEGGNLYFYPISNGSYTIRYTICEKPSFDESDSVLNPIPALDNYLICFATAYTMRSLQMFDFADIWDRKANEALQVAIIGDRKSPEVFRMQPFNPRGKKTENEGLTYDQDTDEISGTIIF